MMASKGRGREGGEEGRWGGESEKE